MIDGKYLAATNDPRAGRSREYGLYLQSNYFWRSKLFQGSEGKPVLLNFGPQHFTTSANWESIFFPCLAATNQPAFFFTEDNRLAPGAGAFDLAAHVVEPGCPETGPACCSSAALKGLFGGVFDQKAGRLAGFLSAEPSRVFHDIYQKGRRQENYWGYPR